MRSQQQDDSKIQALLYGRLMGQEQLGEVESL